MNKINVFAVLSLVSLVINSFAFVDKPRCGLEIPKMLTLVCSSVYYSPQKKNHNDLKNYKMQKFEDALRAIEDFNSKNEAERELLMQQQDALSYPYINRFQGYRMIPHRFKRGAGGIVEECCHKACTFEEMAGYCD
ncbi:PREDICTED: insulin-1-like [Nicrophorus vespilloides]|uniref:Insulin-1-like n=1 Tax=Nicrophorus vespilloides TaxID=110193 RepID=A0ABM1NJM4_NICVS|nr:PREDICTED: insulin-1-like [Nicrophorus vespilloides]